MRQVGLIGLGWAGVRIGWPEKNLNREKIWPKNNFDLKICLTGKKCEPEIIFDWKTIWPKKVWKMPSVTSLKGKRGQWVQLSRVIQVMIGIYLPPEGGTAWVYSLRGMSRKKKFDQKKTILTEKKFWPKKILTEKKFWTKKNFDPKKILTQKNLTQKYWPKNISFLSCLIPKIEMKKTSNFGFRRRP